MFVADEAVGVDQIPHRPVVLIVSIPGGVVVVQDHGVSDVGLFHGLGDAVVILLELELRLVDADGLQSVVGVLLVETVSVRPIMSTRRRSTAM